MVDTKTCSGCGITKELSMFYRDVSCRYGVAPKCKACVYQRTKRHKSTGEFKKRIAAYQRAYRLRHPEKSRLSVKKWQSKNPDRNRWHKRMSDHRRRANGSGKRTPVSLIAELMVKQKHKCVVCKCDIKARFHVDHIMPLKLGGKHEPRNLQLLCPTCNIRKKDKHPADFMQSLGLLI